MILEMKAECSALWYEHTPDGSSGMICLHVESLLHTLALIKDKDLYLHGYQLSQLGLQIIIILYKYYFNLQTIITINRLLYKM